MLKVLFVSSGNLNGGINPIIKAQGESLRNIGVDVEYFRIVGKGFTGYLKNVFLLRRHIKRYQYDIIHAHFSLSALVATLAGCRPLVVSLMGSDIRLGFVFRNAINFSYLLFWDRLIVKSEDMQKKSKVWKSEIIPNGVDTACFKPTDKSTCLASIGWNLQKKHILFAANSSKFVKNFSLCEKAYHALGASGQIMLHDLNNIPHRDIPKYMNAADVVILTSLWEGSPNVVKEAMACNCTIVATDVGDIAWLFGDEAGYFLTSFDADDVANKLEMALKFAEKNGKTNGRRRIMKLRVDSETIAKRIVHVYKTELRKNS